VSLEPQPTTQVAPPPAPGEPLLCTFRLVLDTAPHGMMILGEGGRVLHQNRHADALLGPGGPRARSSLLDLVDEDDRPRVAARLEFEKAGKPAERAMAEPVEAHLVRQDGTRLPVEMNIVAFDGSGSRYLFVGVSDISRRALAERELERKNADLQQFTSLASHDLQEPLRMIVGYCELLETSASATLDERSRIYLKHAADGGRRLQLLVDALLEYAQLGTLQVRPRETDVGALVEEVVRDLRRVVDVAHAEVIVEGLPTAAMVDPVVLRPVFQNLLANALKFRGAAAPHIEVRCVSRRRFHEFSVSDEGIGIVPGQEERIFRMFQRLHAREEYGGSGMGLAFARRLVEIHGGSIWAENRPEKGATFRFRIPIVPLSA